MLSNRTTDRNSHRGLRSRSNSWASLIAIRGCGNRTTMPTSNASTGAFRKNRWIGFPRNFLHIKRPSKPTSATTTESGCTWALISSRHSKNSPKVFQAIELYTYHAHATKKTNTKRTMPIIANSCSLFLSERLLMEADYKFVPSFYQAPHPCLSTYAQYLTDSIGGVGLRYEFNSADNIAL